MVTGVWSKQIASATERRGGEQQGGAMVAASLVLVGVIGLGLRYKLQMLRMFAHEIVWHVHGQRVASAKRATAGSTGAHSRTRAFDSEHGWHSSASGRGRGFGEHGASGGSHGFGERNRAATGSDYDQYRALLGVRRGARKKELKEAYYAAAKRYHPDSRAGDPAMTSNAQFAELKVAYEALKARAES